MYDDTRTSRPINVDVDEPLPKLHHSHHNGSSSQSSPMSLTHDDHHHGHHHAHAHASSQGSGPRRKQARPRRRSGDSIGAASSSLDLSKADSPVGFRKASPGHAHDVDNATPENLSMKRPSSSPAINLVSCIQ